MHVDRGLAGAIACGAIVLAGMVGGASVAAAPSETAVVKLEPPVDDRFATTYPAVGGLEDGSVLRLQLSGFAPGTTGVIHQCVYSAGEIGDCANPFPVNIDDDGRAQAQYQVGSRFAAGTSACAGHVRPCVVVVDDPDGNRAVATTVFGDALPPPAEITVTPAHGLQAGDEVEVRVAGYPPGERVYAVQCSPPGPWGGQHCDAPGDRAGMTIGPDGSGSAVVIVTDGRLGRDGEPCLQARCGISVASDDVWARAAVAPLSFRGTGPASYDLGRVAGAVTVCVGLLIVAFWLWRRTDWSRPTEAATPEMDAAPLD